MVTIVKELKSFRGSACLVQLDDQYYVVSTVDARDHRPDLEVKNIDLYDMFGPETMAFPADAEGNVTDWGEVAGGRGATRESVIAELEQLE